MEWSRFIMSEHTGRLQVSSNYALSEEGMLVAQCLIEGGYDKQGVTVRQDAEANAKRIVHTWNCHDELVEALEGLRNCISETRGKPSYDAVEKADLILTKAKQEQL